MAIADWWEMEGRGGGRSRGPTGGHGSSWANRSWSCSRPALQVDIHKSGWCAGGGGAANLGPASSKMSNKERKGEITDDKQKRLGGARLD